MDKIIPMGNKYLKHNYVIIHNYVLHIYDLFLIKFSNLESSKIFIFGDDH